MKEWLLAIAPIYEPEAPAAMLRRSPSPYPRRGAPHPVPQLRNSILIKVLEPALLKTMRSSSLLSHLSSPVDSHVTRAPLPLAACLNVELSYLHREQMLRSDDEEEEGEIMDYEDSNMALAHYDPSMATQIDLPGTLRAPPINVLNQRRRLAKHAASAPNLSSSSNLQYCSPSSPPTAGPSNISSSQPAACPSPSSPSKQDAPPTSDLNKGHFKYRGY
ncbi:hypothetical protein CPB84DRAFT_1844324 [Gymnopilus junonius]|uniref:Uncharacterized protein n=1 Tax=Gymnopilus junonius TaxID=109634 RepID=A0A9P5NV99_GYMJU|nr:hypothetical protein CPB84DRAFT_1844324 [Gymnopilus junonius]